MNFIGIDDNEFIRGKVPMTKQEIRILSLVKAHIAPAAMVADIGAGTGSFTIEAARLASHGKVFAIERNNEGVELIKANAEKFNLSNIEIIAAEAPCGLAKLPKLDAVFIGGSGNKLPAILAEIAPKLKAAGRIVINCITLQTLMQTIDYMRAQADIFSYETIMVQVNHWQQHGLYDMAKAENPIYIITCIKKG